MNDCTSQPSPNCYVHPKQLVVGVCSLCLRERLLVLASKQGQIAASKDTNRPFRYLRRKPTINRLKVFAITTFLHLLEPRHSTSNCRDDLADSDGDETDEDVHSTASCEDSFISIKFEKNGHTAWDYKQATNDVEPSVDTNNSDTSTKVARETKSMVGHIKHSGPLRWRKRMSQLLQLARWKKSSKASTCHVGLGGKVDAFKGRRSWIRSLTRRTTAID